MWVLVQARGSNGNMHTGTTTHLPGGGPGNESGRSEGREPTADFQQDQGSV